MHKAKKKSALQERAQAHAPPQEHAEEEEEEEEEGRRRPQVRGGARQVHYYLYMRAHTTAIYMSAYCYYICVRILAHMRARCLAAGACTRECGCGLGVEARQVRMHTCLLRMRRHTAAIHASVTTALYVSAYYYIATCVFSYY
jgi:hypothetical protein